MSAIGFGRNVTGSGNDPNRTIIEVTSGREKGKGTLAKAIEDANAEKKDVEIVILTNVEPRTKELLVQVENLTIRAEGGAVIDRNHFVIDCAKADNVLLTDLRFDSDGLRKPTDTISIHGVEGRGPIGIWIDHCSFEAYFDLNVTSNTRDLKGAPPLLITVSHCRFHDRDPTLNRDHGALGIHGFGKKDKDSQERTREEDKNTNTYATICRNYFDNCRRRSPRSSNRTFVHAFNNVLEKWGTANPGDDPDQENGMSAGHFGILAVEANYFLAGALKATVEIARREDPRVYAGKGKLVNVYAKDAEQVVDHGTPPIDIAAEYREGLGSTARPPDVEEMTDALVATIKREAGAR